MMSYDGRIIQIEFYSRDSMDIFEFIEDREEDTYEIAVEDGGIYVVRTFG